jgi:AcrR family transcriptional regulator
MTAKQLEKRQKKRASAAGPRRATRPGPPAAPYHHGALHEALLKAAETVLERDGLTGLTLRAAAREAGVSHAAPTHHFGDMSGLLSELAAAGFRKFGAALSAAAASETSAKERLVAMGEAYVTFAGDYPGMFLLMFRSERLDVTRPGLREAMDQAFAVLTRGVSDRRGTASSPLAMIADVTRSWALVHGLAMLMLDHRLDHIVAHLPEDADARDLLRAVLTMR